MSELTDALIQLIGPDTGLMVVILVMLDVAQTRYLSEKIDALDEDIGDVRSRVRRVEGEHMEADGGDPQ